MDIAKIVVVGLLFAVIIVYLQSINKEIALLATIVGGIVILISIINSLYQIFNLYSELANKSGISHDIIKLIIKIILICYLIEFATGIIEDFGLKSLADKVALAGKLIILMMSAPIIISLLDLIKNLIE